MYYKYRGLACSLVHHPVFFVPGSALVNYTGKENVKLEKSFEFNEGSYTKTLVLELLTLNGFGGSLNISRN